MTNKSQLIADFICDQLDQLINNLDSDNPEDREALHSILCRLEQSKKDIWLELDKDTFNS